MTRMISLRGAAESYLLDASSSKNSSSKPDNFYDAGNIKDMTPEQMNRFGVKKK